MAVATSDHTLRVPVPRHNSSSALLKPLEGQYCSQAIGLETMAPFSSPFPGSLGRAGQGKKQVQALEFNQMG